MSVSQTTPSLVLAPMDGVTDYLMREMLTELMPFTHCVTEFVRVSAASPPAKTFLGDAPELKTASKTSSGTPVHIQILGGIPEAMAQSAALAVSLGAQAVDINFGCPAPTVNRHDGGATLLKFPERIEAIVRAVRNSVPQELPVSAKLRLGWDDPTAIHHNAERAARGGASWITIHGRTKFQGYTPPAYWKPIGEVKRALDIPVIANGEIWELDDLKRCQDESQCQHFMLGRGVLANPQLVAECAKYLGLSITEPLQESETPRSVIPHGVDKGDWAPLIKDLVQRSVTRGESERRTLSRCKQWLQYAHKRGSIHWFDSVKRTTTIQEFLSALSIVDGELAP